MTEVGTGAGAMKVTDKDNPTHGITTDPLTGRRYVLAYVELGTRVVDALYRENGGWTTDHTDKDRRRTAKRGIKIRGLNAGNSRYIKGTTNKRWEPNTVRT